MYNLYDFVEILVNFYKIICHEIPIKSPHQKNYNLYIIVPTQVDKNS